MFVEGNWHVEVCSEARVDRTEPLFFVGPLPPSNIYVARFFVSNFGVTEVAPNRNGFGVHVKFTLSSEIR